MIVYLESIYRKTLSSKRPTEASTDLIYPIPRAQIPNDRLIKRGKNYILTGHKKPEFIASKEHKFGTPNHYAVEQVEAMKDYFKIVKVG